MLIMILVRLWRGRLLLRDMVWKQLRGKYSGSMLGIWWAVITPFILAASIGFVFNYVVKVNVHNFTIFVLSGIVTWLCFSNSLFESVNSFETQASLLKQGILPFEFIPLSSLISNFLSFLIGLFFLSPLFMFFNQKILYLVPLLFWGLFVYFLFITGVGLLFATADVFCKDVKHFLSIGVMVWFWVTPVFYSLEMIDFPCRWVCLMNPLTYYITFIRNVLVGGVVPSLVTVMVSSLLGILSFIGGYTFSLKKEKEILKRI